MQTKAKMTEDYLSQERDKIARNHACLLHLMTPGELEILALDIPDGETPLWQHWENYVVKTLVLGKSPVTVRAVRDGLNIIMRHTGILTIEQANAPGRIGDALLALQIERGQKPSTRNTYIKNLNTYFIWLYKNHLIDQNNVARVEKGREAPPDVIPLSQEEIEKTVLHIGTRHHSTELERARNVLMIDIFRYSGVRPCELLGMENDAIYDKHGEWRMVVNGRKQKGRLRYYIAPSFLVHSYQHYMRLRAEKERWEKPLFISLSSHEGWKMRGLQAFFKKVSNELGFRVTAYGFRRFIASQMSRSGIARDDISRYLGHTRFTTTDRYIARECHLTKNGSELMAQVYTDA
jgi:integrase